MIYSQVISNDFFQWSTLRRTPCASPEAPTKTLPSHTHQHPLEIWAARLSRQAATGSARAPVLRTKPSESLPHRKKNFCARHGIASFSDMKLPVQTSILAAFGDPLVVNSVPGTNLRPPLGRAGWLELSADGERRMSLRAICQFCTWHETDAVVSPACSLNAGAPD